MQQGEVNVGLNADGKWARDDSNVLAQAFGRQAGYLPSPARRAVEVVSAATGLPDRTDVAHLRFPVRWDESAPAPQPVDRAGGRHA